jgi:hypothetical protein
MAKRGRRVAFTCASMRSMNSMQTSRKRVHDRRGHRPDPLPCKHDAGIRMLRIRPAPSLWNPHPDKRSHRQARMAARIIKVRRACLSHRHDARGR